MDWLMVAVIVSTHGVGKFGAESEVDMRLYPFASLAECVAQGEEWAQWPAWDYVCLPVASTDDMHIDPETGRHSPVSGTPAEAGDGLSREEEGR